MSFGLQKIGTKKGDRIGVLSHNSYEFFLLYGAATQLGAVMVPINWRLTPAEVEYILKDVQPRFVFAGMDYGNTVEAIAGNLGFVEKFFTFGSNDSEFTAFSTRTLPQFSVIKIGLF